jgi:hypothetical protein
MIQRFRKPSGRSCHLYTSAIFTVSTMTVELQRDSAVEFAPPRRPASPRLAEAPEEPDHVLAPDQSQH